MSVASAQVRWALLAGNFVIGCGVMVVAGTLNDLAHSLGVSVALAGQLIALGALVMGIGDISQIASLTVLYLIIVEMGIFRDLKPQALWAITKESMALIGAIFIIIYSATALTNYLVTAEVPAKLVHWTREHIDSRWAFLLALNGLLLLTGMVMDIFSAILIVVPLIAPVAHEYDISPYHLGVIFLLNLEIGYLHPPIGLNLFISSFRFNRPVAQVYRVVIPYVVLLHVGLVALIVFPSLSTFSMRGDAAKLRKEAEAKSAPPIAAWVLECVQMDKANAHPCSAEDKYHWDLDGKRNIPMSRDDNDRKEHAALLEPAHEVQPAHLRHAHVGDDAAGLDEAARPDARRPAQARARGRAQADGPLCENDNGVSDPHTPRLRATEPRRGDVR